jgi:hypothetical protein
MTGKRSDRVWRSLVWSDCRRQWLRPPSDYKRGLGRSMRLRAELENSYPQKFLNNRSLTNARGLPDKVQPAFLVYVERSQSAAATPLNNGASTMKKTLRSHSARGPVCHKEA